eukprot:TRINITY_DN3539_c1_g1_i1.p1 TRINITY_DN3539_c1_g1~~TRINITY_DN3539_c1_g1_i1.p1  ORF type:complete len:133 (+),score=19.34 TRINITY_DN3539_c1_g1_i1:373-771(+)
MTLIAIERAHELITSHTLPRPLKCEREFKEVQDVVTALENQDTMELAEALAELTEQVEKLEKRKTRRRRIVNVLTCIQRHGFGGLNYNGIVMRIGAPAERWEYTASDDNAGHVCKNIYCLCCIPSVDWLSTD